MEKEINAANMSKINKTLYLPDYNGPFVYRPVIKKPRGNNCSDT